MVEAGSTAASVPPQMTTLTPSRPRSVGSGRPGVLDVTSTNGAQASASAGSARSCAKVMSCGRLSARAPTTSSNSCRASSTPSSTTRHGSSMLVSQPNSGPATTTVIAASWAFDTSAKTMAVATATSSPSAAPSQVSAFCSRSQWIGPLAPSPSGTRVIGACSAGIGAASNAAVSAPLVGLAVAGSGGNRRPRGRAALCRRLRSR